MQINQKKPTDESMKRTIGALLLDMKDAFDVDNENVIIKN